MSQDMLDESSTLESKVCDSIIGVFLLLLLMSWELVGWLFQQS